MGKCGNGEAVVLRGCWSWNHQFLLDQEKRGGKGGGDSESPHGANGKSDSSRVGVVASLNEEEERG